MMFSNFLERTANGYKGEVHQNFLSLVRAILIAQYVHLCLRMYACALCVCLGVTDPR